MLLKIGDPIYTECFVYADAGGGAAGLVGTVDIRRNGVLVLSAQPVVEIGDGLYSYTLAGGYNIENGAYSFLYRFTLDGRDVVAPVTLTVGSSVIDQITSMLQTLLDRLTAVRAAALDLLDVAVSTRLAAASYVAPDNAGILAAIAALPAAVWSYTTRTLTAFVLGLEGNVYTPTPLDSVIEEETLTGTIDCD